MLTIVVFVYVFSRFIIGTFFNNDLFSFIFTLFDKPAEGLAPNKILDQFDGKKASPDANWQVKKDGGEIDFISGATVTSRAVTLLVSEIDRTYLLNRDKIMQELTPAGGK